MVDDARKAEMRRYQQRRSAIRREHGLVTRTYWIWEEDSDAFRAAVAPFIDRARLIEALLGTLPLPTMDLVDIVKTHDFPYDPTDIVFLAELRTKIELKPREGASLKTHAEKLLAQYDLPVTVDDLLA